MTSASRGALLAVALLSCSLVIHAQPDNQPSGPAGPAGDTPPAPEPAPAPAPSPAPAPASTQGTPLPPAAAPAPGGAASAPSDARDALKKQAGDVDQSTLLKETLTKQDRQYSLLKAGRIQTNYDLNYQYIGVETINTGLDDSGALDLFQIENTRSHTVTNSVSVDYGLFDNLTLFGTVPLVSKFTQSEHFSGTANAFGDLSFGARYQPLSQTPTGATYTLTGSFTVPSGRSPFKEIQNQNLSTGAGYPTATLGMNASTVMDPVALFGSLNFTLAGQASGLHQVVGPVSAPTVLTNVQPGKSLGFGAGFTYALSYNVSTSITFQEMVTTASHIDYLDANNVAKSRGTAQQVSALLNFGFGVRLSPKTTVNLSAGIGLTNDSPDFNLDLNVPLTFAAF
jgi:hypothetical protein